MTLNNLHDLFEHELKDIYDAESRLVDALRQQAAESTDPEVRAGFERHHKQTQGHKKRLEEVFRIWGKEATRGPGCAGIQGLLEEHKEFKAEKPAPAILDVFNLTAATKVERYEISAYESLIRLANQMGLDEAVDILGKTLDEEETTLDAVQELLDSSGRMAGIRSGAPRNPRSSVSTSRSRSR